MIEPPVFVFDSREKWFPVGVEESIAASRAGGGVQTNPIRLDFPAGMTPASLPAVGYHRVQAAAGLWWHQFWLWYLYNPGPPALRGVGRHEGDWEFVQIACAEPEARPVLVTCSQHKTGGKREHWACELQESRVVVYAALGSHANFLNPGRHGLDECNARGRRVDLIEWRRFGRWGRFEGRWGNSRGEGQSPISPGLQGDRCDRPHLFHSAAA